tara:strand:+ start:187 stop:537 length:351 start_codon:yes stop_codon:yes gene_type:complete
MTHTTTIIADHKGISAPKVTGDEYYVDANINITSYTEDGEIITATELGLSRVTAVMITGCEVASGVALERFVVELSATGEYESGASFALVGTTASSGAESANGDLGFVRVRAYGLI